MKQVTNEVYRTKRKLKLLEEDGIGQLLFDFNKYMNKKANNEIVEVSTEYIISELKQKYLSILEDYKPYEQINRQLYIMQLTHRPFFSDTPI